MPARRVAEHLLGHPRVRVGVLAHGVQLVLAGPAVAAGDRERHDDAVADLQVADAPADLDDLAHELVAEDVALLHRRDVAVVEVQVRAADRRRGDLHDRVAVVEDLRVRDVLDLDRVAARPDVGPHRRPPSRARPRPAAGPGAARACARPLALGRAVGARDLAGLDERLEAAQLIHRLRPRRRRRSASSSDRRRVSTSTWISVPRSPGASWNVASAPSSGSCSRHSRSSSSRGRRTVIVGLLMPPFCRCGGHRKRERSGFCPRAVGGHQGVAAAARADQRADVVDVARRSRWRGLLLMR